MRSSLYRHCMLLIGLVMPLCGFAQDRPGPDDLSLLRAVNQAASSTSFVGVFSHQQTQGVYTARLYHAVAADGPTVRLESLDGPAREIIRSSDGVRAYLPDRREIRVTPHRPLRPDFPMLFLGDGRELLRHYRVKVKGGYRVAGLETDLIELVPNDALRWRVRCWVERNRKLLLKQQLLDADGSIREEYVFSEIRLGPVSERLVRSRFEGQTGWTQSLSPMRKVTPPAASADLTGGFVLTAALANADGSLRQWVLSDGLATVSLFAERRPPAMADGGFSQHGSLSMVTRQRGDFAVTALGEVPLQAATALAETFPAAWLQQSP
jgi:sigma-E factor negative regulatory protein RseB